MFDTVRQPRHGPRILLATVVGGLLGVGAGLGAHAESLQARMHPVVPEPCTSREQLEATVATLSERLQSAAGESEVERSRELARTGKKVSWPGDVDPKFRRAGVRSSLQGAFQELGGGSLLELVCDEFPCVAAVLMPPPTKDPLWRTRFEEHMRQAGYALDPKGRLVILGDPERAFYTLALGADPMDYPVIQRSRYRVELVSGRAWFTVRDLTEGAR
jgi:hypothetical protein